MRKMFPRQENPYFDSDKIATPYPNSLRSAYCGTFSVCIVILEGDSSNLVTADLELGHVPGRVLVRRPLDPTELSLISRDVAVDVKRQLD